MSEAFPARARRVGGARSVLRYDEGEPLLFVAVQERSQWPSISTSLYAYF